MVSRYQINDGETPCGDLVGIGVPDRGEAAAVAVRSDQFACWADLRKEVGQAVSPAAAEVQHPVAIPNPCEGGNAGMKVIPGPKWIQGAHEQSLAGLVRMS